MSTTDKAQLRVGMVGYAFMGAAHSQAWRTVNRVFDLPAQATMVAVAGRDRAKVTEAAGRLGWAEAVTDWHDLVSRDDIDLIDICTPGDSHQAIALAALAAGKHVLCEKPLANTVAEARAMARAAADAGTRLRTLISIIREEADNDRAGRDAILARLIDVMLVETLRSAAMWSPDAGVLAALADPHLARALADIHSDVGRGWTVGELARRAGLSRSVGCARSRPTT